MNRSAVVFKYLAIPTNNYFKISKIYISYWVWILFLKNLGFDFMLKNPKRHLNLVFLAKEIFF